MWHVNTLGLLMANEQNLIYPGITTKEQAKRLGKIGGSRSTPKKKWAAQLREMKKKGLTDDNYKKFVGIFEEPEMSILDIFTYVQSIKSHCKNAGQMNNVAQTLIQIHRSHHGDKNSGTNVNIQTNDAQNVVINIVDPRKKKVDENGLHAKS